MLLFLLILVEFDVLPISYDVLPTEYAILDTQAIATDGPSHDAAKPATDGLIRHRKAAYKAAYDACERDGKAVYRSDGLIGQPLPKGLYELIRHQGEVWFIEVAPAGVPIPKPDPAALFQSDCIGQA